MLLWLNQKTLIPSVTHISIYLLALNPRCKIFSDFSELRNGDALSNQVTLHHSPSQYRHIDIITDRFFLEKSHIKMGIL